MVNSLTELTNQDEAASDLIKAYYSKTLNLLTKRFKEGQKLNQFRDDISAKKQAQIILASLVGMVALTKGPMSKSASLSNAKNIIKLIEK